MVEQYKYDAFISYTHRDPATPRQSDQQIAHLLHQFLERYHPPKKYKDQRIRRVFIDTDELPTSSDLAAQITTELQQSRFLIIVCSHEYQQSIYCKAELEYFLKIHNGNTQNVLVVLADGEPKDVFPAALLPDADIQQNPLLMRIEPLGADVRGFGKVKDSQKMNKEFLRIAAPIFGCGFDDLYRRHLRRKRKNVLLSCALFLLVLGGIVTLVIEKNRQITLQADQKHQQQAEMVADKVKTILSNKEGARVDAQSALLLASTYIQQPDLANQSALEYALVSAVAQSALNENTNVFPRVLYLKYPYEDQGITGSIFYCIAPSDTVLFADTRDAKEAVLYDVQTGAKLRDIGHAQMTITNDAHYLFAYQNEYAADNTVVRTITLTDLYTLQNVFSKPLTEVAPDDHIITTVCGNDGPFAVYNDSEFLCAFLSDGTEISQSEFEDAFHSSNSLVDESPAPFDIVLPRKEDVCYVTDRDGTVLLTLPKDIGYYSFSTDYSRMVYVLDNIVTVLDTSTWSVIDTFPCPTSSTDILSSTYILDANPNLISLMMEKTDVNDGSDPNYVCVYDIATDTYLLQDEPGYRLDDQRGNRFYLCSRGQLSAFTYKEDNMRQLGDILKMSVQNGTALVESSEWIQLLQMENGTSLLRCDPATQQLVYSPDLSNLLVSGVDQGICLYGKKGNTEWSMETDGVVDCLAISEDASTIAYGSGTEIHLLNLQGSSQGEYTLSFTPKYLAISGNSVYAATSSEGVLIVDGTVLKLDSALPFGRGQFIGDRLVMLDQMQSALNFVVCDLSGKVVYRPVNGVGSFQYAAKTGLLAIQECSQNGYPYPSIIVMKVTETSIDLFENFEMLNQYDQFLFDQTGKYLTITGENGTSVYQLEQNKQIMQLYGVKGIYQEGCMFASFATDKGVFSQLLDHDHLLAYATQRLTSEHGLREITADEIVIQ